MFFLCKNMHYIDLIFESFKINQKTIQFLYKVISSLSLCCYPVRQDKTSILWIQSSWFTVASILFSTFNFNHYYLWCFPTTQDSRCGNQISLNLCEFFSPLFTKRTFYKWWIVSIYKRCSFTRTSKNLCIVFFQLLKKHCKRCSSIGMNISEFDTQNMWRTGAESGLFRTELIPGWSCYHLKMLIFQ